MPYGTDEEVAALVQRGDRAAFNELVVRYEDKITRYGRKFLFGGDDVKDLVQDVFLKAYMNIRDFDATRRFSPWIYRIAHNEFINAIAKRTKVSFTSLDSDVLFPHPVATETADRDATLHELREVLDQSLGKIDMKYREPIVLYYFEDLDYKQISEILQIPQSTVGVRLTRGKALLRSYMTHD